MSVGCSTFPNCHILSISLVRVHVRVHVRTWHLVRVQIVPSLFLRTYWRTCFNDWKPDLSDFKPPELDEESDEEWGRSGLGGGLWLISGWSTLAHLVGASKSLEKYKPVGSIILGKGWIYIYNVHACIYIYILIHISQTIPNPPAGHHPKCFDTNPVRSVGWSDANGASRSIPTHCVDIRSFSKRSI